MKIWLPANQSEVVVKIDKEGKVVFDQQPMNLTLQPIDQPSGFSKEEGK